MDAKVSVLCLLLFLSRGHSSDVMERQADPVATMTTVVNQLTAQVNTLNAEVTSMNAEVLEKNTAINALSSDLHDAELLINSLARQLRLNDIQLSYLDTYSHNNVDSLTPRTATLETPVAFTVRFTDDDVGSLHGDHGVLLFDQVQYQVGGQNYNTSTGNFTAPSRGVYAFFVTVQRNDTDIDQCLQVTLMKNNGYLGCQAVACPPGYTSSSLTCLTHMYEGDVVRAVSTRYSQIFGHVHTTFSGVRISPK